MENTNDFDSMITTHTMKLIKTALPYIDISEQRFLSIYLKFSEFLNTVQLFSQKSAALSACKKESSGNNNFFEMINALKTVCDDSERDTLDMMLNFIQAMQLYKTYSEFYKASGEFTPNAENTTFNFNNMDVLKTFLTPEQQTMFDTYKSLF